MIGVNKERAAFPEKDPGRRFFHDYFEKDLSIHKYSAVRKLYIVDPRAVINIRL